MKHIMPILITWTSLHAFAQGGKNQWTNDSLKVGEWVYFDQAGRVKSKTFYEVANRRLSVGEAFFENIDLSVDSIRKFERVLWEEHYTYLDNGNSVRIARSELGKGTAYYFGKNKDLRLYKFDTVFLNRVGVVDTLKLRFWKSKNCQGPRMVSVSLKGDTIIEQLNDEVRMVNYSTPVEVQPGFNNHYISIQCNGTKAPFRARVFGYHLTTDDFQNEKLIRLDEEFAYYRTGSETLLKVCKKKRSAPMLTIPLGQDRKVIELKALENGHYWFCVVDFANKQEYWKKVKIER